VAAVEDEASVDEPRRAADQFVKRGPVAVAGPADQGDVLFAHYASRYGDDDCARGARKKTNHRVTEDTQGRNTEEYSLVGQKPEGCLTQKRFSVFSSLCALCDSVVRF